MWANKSGKKLAKEIDEIVGNIVESLPPSCKKVVQAFLDKKEGESKKLKTDGKRLDGLWMGGRGIAEWKDGKILFRDLGSKAAQDVERAVRKAAPKNWLGESGGGIEESSPFASNKSALTYNLIEIESKVGKAVGQTDQLSKFPEGKHSGDKYRNIKRELSRIRSSISSIREDIGRI